MDNKKIAEVFEEVANILDISGANFFRVNAYRKGALTVENLSQDLRKIVKEDPKKISEISGIGKGLADMIVELVETGASREHEKMRENIPEGLLDILKLRGVGPKKVKMFYMKLAIKDIAELKDAAEKGLLNELDGMGKKSEAEILKAIDEYTNFSHERVLIHEAQQEADALVEHLKKLKEVKQISFCGSLRRRRETIGDIDILVTLEDPEKNQEKVMKHFAEYEEVVKIVGAGDTKSTVFLNSGIDADLRVVADESFGAAQHYFTGSKDHNVRVRDIAKKKGMKVNEYGVFEGDKMVAGASEKEVFAAVGLPFIPPELRQDKGEFELKKTPRLVEMEDIRADMHNHSTFSDGKNSLEEMADAFEAMGYDYFAITDHSKLMPIAKGMDKAKIKKQWKEIEALNERKGRIKILKGCEVDILKDGALDFEDEVLEKLDVVVVSAHLWMNLPEKDQTKRIIAAIENPYSMILGHPTGRLINKRPGMDFDMEAVIDACVANKVALEINAQPMRLDLAEKYVRIGKEKGAKFVIDTDSHNVGSVEFMKYGVGMARRGWLEPDEVLNTGSWKEFKSYFG